MPRLAEVRAHPGYGLWLRYDDGWEGTVDVSHLAGRGVFEAWEEAGVFESVYLSPHGAVAWGDAIELCPDALYLRLTGKSVDDHFPDLVKTPSDA